MGREFAADHGLVNQGYALVKVSEAKMLRIELDTQVVAFSPDRPQYKFAGERTALVAGAWVLTGVEHSAEAAIERNRRA